MNPFTYCILCFALAAFLLCPVPNVKAVQPKGPLFPLNPDFLAALRIVESSNKEGPIFGDHREALGPYQIHYEYWCDAVDYDPDLGGLSHCWADCQDEAYARKVVMAYLNRYAHNRIIALDFEWLARIHHAGPTGGAHGFDYWRKVHKALQRVAEERRQQLIRAQGGDMRNPGA